MTSDMDRLAGSAGRREDDGAATGDSSDAVSGADAGLNTNRTDFASGGTDDALVRPGWQPDQGPPIVAERDADETDIGRDAGGSVAGHDAAGESGFGGMTGGGRWSGSMGGADSDDAATTGDMAGTSNGGMTAGGTLAGDPGIGGDAGEPTGLVPNDAETAGPDRGDAFDRLRLDHLDEEGGTPIAGPKDRSDIGNLRGGQHDAGTGGSDLGPTEGGGDTGAV